MPTLKEVFDKHFEDVEFDGEFAKRIMRFNNWWLTRTPEHMEFFTGDLLGVHRVRFRSQDLIKFMVEVCGVDPVKLNKDLDKVPTVMKVNKVTSDVLNLTIVYLIHRFLNSEDKGAYQGAQQAAVLFFFRSFAALISDYFWYQADPAIVRIALNNLNANSLIRKLGNWLKVVEYRVEKLLDPEGIHFRTLKELNDKKVDYVISDSKDRIKDMILNYYSEIMKVKDSGERVDDSSMIAVNDEGEEGFVDLTDASNRSLSSIRGILSSGKGFVDKKLISLSRSYNRNTSISAIDKIVKWVSDNYLDPKYHNLIDHFIVSTVGYTFYLIENKVSESKRKDLGLLLLEVRNLYLSTRSRDSELLEIRENADQIVEHAMQKKMNKGLKLASRNALILYIVLMIFKTDK